MQKNTLREQPQYAELASAIVEHAAGRTIVFVPNRGNWGDALIAEGSRLFFRTFRLDVRELSFSSVRRRPWLKMRWRSGSLRPLVLYGGGGALAGAYPGRTRGVLAMLRAADRSLVMPSTFGSDAVAFEALSGLVAFRRDEFDSRRHFSGARFCHDMAFFLSPQPAPVRRENGFFFRGDRERAWESLRVPCNRDVSVEGTDRSPAAEFFRIVGEAEVIWTDRLHVAIAGALLGREVHLFANSYFKNEAVFRSSLEPHFPRVRFHEDFGAVAEIAR